MDYAKTQKRLAPLLRPLSSLYRALMERRAQAYLSGQKATRQPKSFCVAVGNIAWGGSGKTPMADWLLTWAAERGLSAALLTRGYGGKSKERPLPVRADTSPAQSGDEALMLARRHPEAHILADPVRSRALAWLEANTSANFIVLDDAMQHLAVQRHLNLVLLRAKDLDDAHWGRVIPAGEWREGPQALGRASAFLLRMSAAEFTNSAALIEKRLAGFKKPVFSFQLSPTGLRLPAPNMHSQEAILPGLGGRPYALCTGVGSPETVLADTTALLGQGPQESFIFPDHHRFNAADLARLAKTGLPVIVTAKDAVKIEPLTGPEQQLEYYVLESRLNFGPALYCPSDFPAWFTEEWQTHS